MAAKGLRDLPRAGGAGPRRAREEPDPADLSVQTSSARPAATPVVERSAEVPAVPAQGATRVVAPTAPEAEAPPAAALITFADGQVNIPE